MSKAKNKCKTLLEKLLSATSRFEFIRAEIDLRKKMKGNNLCFADIGSSEEALEEQAAICDAADRDRSLISHYAGLDK